MKTNRTLVTVLLASAALLFSACATPNGGTVSVGWGEPDEHETRPPVEVSRKTGPPSHAPAHGYRAKHTYRYYPNERTYYDTERHLYFYFDGGIWQVAVSLPATLRLSTDYVTIELSTDKPYEHYEEHRGKYPPGKMKKKEKHKKNRWAKKVEG